MCLKQFLNYSSRPETCIFGQRLWEAFQGSCKFSDGILLQSWKSVRILREFYG